MDHGLFEMEGSAMSPVRVDGFELCDNISNSEALAAQSRNLNETLAQTLPLSPNDEGGTRGAVHKPPLDNGGTEGEEVATAKEERSGGTRDEEEDDDEVMKEEEEEEEEESEASSSLICCQSPDTPMTDSSYSETGSLLETPYPFSPGTSPEPTSPVTPVVSPETLHPVESAELNRSVVGALSGTADSGSYSTFTAESADLTSHVTTAATRPDGSSGSRCSTAASEAILKDSCAEQLTSSKEPVTGCRPASTRGTSSSSTGPVCISPESSPFSVTAEPSTFNTGSKTTSTSCSLPTSSNREQVTSPPVADDSLSPTLLASLEELAGRDDDTHLPLYLHQIAETFVLQKDYRRALLFIQLEQLYHRRVLENLNALQEQWASLSGGATPELTATHLDSLQHICQTHSRPRTRDAEVALLDNLRRSFDGGVSRPSCISIPRRVKGVMEQGAEDSFCLSANVLERLSLPDTDREHPDGKSEGRDIFYGSELTGKQAHSAEVEGGEQRGAPAPANGLHPSTAGGMDRSEPSEQQEEDLGPAGEAEAREEEEEDKSEVEEAAEAREMEDEGTEDDGEDEQSKGDSLLCQGAPSEETLVSGEEVQLHWDASAQEKLHAYQETQEDSETCPNEEALPSQEAEPEQQEQYAGGREEEEDCEAEFSRRDPSLDDMAKLITVEEISPAAGLVSILKKRSVRVDRLTEPADPEPREPERPTAKRRVRFKVPDDSYDHDVGGVDSCLLLFLLCLVTVVISIGGTTLYCALGDAQSSVCQDFSRNAEFYIDQIRRGIAQLQHWYTSGL